MQAIPLFLSENLTVNGAILPASGHSPTRMDYLLLPVADQLMERASQSINAGANWLWIGFSTVPTALALQGVTSGSWIKDPDRLPDSASLDGIIIQQQLSWLNFQKVFTMCRQLLKPGGEIFFSTFGPDTLFEIRQGWQAVDDMPHVHDFTDLHTLGDALVQCGFEKPILDTDWQGVEYEDIDLVISDLRGQQFQNRHRDRRKTLTGKNRMQAFRAMFADQNPLRVTFEIIYGFARVPDGRSGSIRVSIAAVDREA